MICFATIIVLSLAAHANGFISDKIDPICKQNFGLYPNLEDSTKFYKCHHGISYKQECPPPLRWHQAIKQCDWPGNVPKRIRPKKVIKPKKVTKTIENHWILDLPDPKELWKEEAKAKAKSKTKAESSQAIKSPATSYSSESSSPDVSPSDSTKTAENGKYIYLTFDDGPNQGTDFVLDALAKTNVKATFFINSYQLPWTKSTWMKLVDSGHVLADHSFDHMKDNSGGTSWNAYQNVEHDLKNFGTSNLDPVVESLKSSGRKSSMEFIKKTLDTYIRMPYTNNWRIGEMDIYHNCPTCTSPAISGENGIEIADRLAAAGKKVIGWDMEWLGASSLQHNGAYTFQQLSGARTQAPGKIMMLMHDRAFSNDHAKNELITFIELAKADGYKFSTVDKYETDKASSSEK